MRVTLTMTAAQHASLQGHLFPGDGREAAALLLCGRANGPHMHRLVTRAIHRVPYDECSVRTHISLTWNTDGIVPLLEQAERESLTVVKLHSHPTGMAEFSEIDTASDLRLLPAIRDWLDVDRRHGSVVMLPDGSMFGRVLNASGGFANLDAITVVGDNIRRWSKNVHLAESDSSHAQAFGEGTFRAMGDLSIAVVGCSGTGGPGIEQLARLRPREIVLIDEDVVEERNLNRIPHATREDALQRRPKVEVLAAAVRAMGLGTLVRTLQANLASIDAIRAVAECDMVFGCVDTIDGRFLLNRIASFYLMPYIDLGVRLVADHDRGGEIRAICGTTHYLIPGGSSLVSRGLFTLEQAIEALRTTGLRLNDPAAYAQQVKDGYLRGVAVPRPAVVGINTALASMATMELLARLHPFRDESNSAYHAVQLDFAGMQIFHEAHPEPCEVFARDVGKGDQRALLGLTCFDTGADHD